MPKAEPFVFPPKQLFLTLTIERKGQVMYPKLSQTAVKCHPQQSQNWSYIYIFKAEEPMTLKNGNKGQVSTSQESPFISVSG